MPLNTGIGRKAPDCCSFVDVVGVVGVAAEIVVNQTWGKPLINMHETCMESEFVLPECQGMSWHFTSFLVGMTWRDSGDSILQPELGYVVLL